MIKKANEKTTVFGKRILVFSRKLTNLGEGEEVIKLDASGIVLYTALEKLSTICAGLFLYTSVFIFAYMCLCCHFKFKISWLTTEFGAIKFVKKSKQINCLY